MFFAKLSLFLLYLRVFAPQRHMRYLIYFGIGFGFCLYWLLVPIEAYFCAPAPGKSVPVGLVQGPLNVVEDIFILLLPVRSVLNLHLPLNRKLQILGIFMTGIMSVLQTILWNLPANEDQGYHCECPGHVLSHQTVARNPYRSDLVGWVSLDLPVSLKFLTMSGV